MKLYKITGLMAIMLSTTLFGAPKEIEINRGNIMLRSAVQGKIGTDGFGYFALGSMKQNITFEQTINDKVVDFDTKGVFIEELRFGPTWATKLGKANFLTRLTYHPMYMLSEPGAFYIRHLVDLDANIVHKIGKAKLHHRIILRNHLPGEDGLGNEFDNELFIRLLSGPTISINKKVDLVIEGEVFLKTTADVGDADGEELVNNILLWAGADLKINPSTKLLFRYVGQRINLINNDIMTKTIWDHNAHLNVVISIPNKNKGNK